MSSLIEPEWLDPHFGSFGHMPPIRDAADKLHVRYVNTDVEVARDEITKRHGMNAYLLAINLGTYREDPRYQNEARREVVGNIGRLIISGDALASLEEELPAQECNPAVGVVIGDLERGPERPLWSQLSVLALRLAARDLQIEPVRLDPVESFISNNRSLLDVQMRSMIEPRSIYDSVVYAMAVARDDLTFDTERVIRAA